MRVFHPQPGEMVQPSSTVDLLLSSVKSTQRLAKGQHGAVVEHELEGTAHEEEEETSEQAQLRRWQESQQELKAWRQKSLYRLRRLEQGQEEEEGEAEWRRLQRRQQEEEWLQRVLSLEEIRSSEVLAESLASLKDPAVLSSTKTQQLGGNSPSPTTGGSTGPTEKVTMFRSRIHRQGVLGEGDGSLLLGDANSSPFTAPELIPRPTQSIKLHECRNPVTEMADAAGNLVLHPKNFSTWAHHLTERIQDRHLVRSDKSLSGRSRIPADYFVYESTPFVQTLTRDELENSVLDEDTGIWHRLLFPVAVPESREQALFLAKTLERMTEEEAIRGDHRRMMQPAFQDKKWQEYANLLEDVESQVGILQTISNELVRQISCGCMERGMLTKYIFDRMRELLLSVYDVHRVMLRVYSYGKAGVNADAQRAEQGRERTIAALKEEVRSLQRKLEKQGHVIEHLTEVNEQKDRRLDEVEENLVNLHAFSMDQMNSTTMPHDELEKERLRRQNEKYNEMLERLLEEKNRREMELQMKHLDAEDKRTDEVSDLMAKLQREIAEKHRLNESIRHMEEQFERDLQEKVFTKARDLMPPPPYSEPVFCQTELSIHPRSEVDVHIVPSGEHIFRQAQWDDLRRKWAARTIMCALLRMRPSASACPDTQRRQLTPKKRITSGASRAGVPKNRRMQKILFRSSGLDPKSHAWIERVLISFHKEKLLNDSNLDRSGSRRMTAAEFCFEFLRHRYGTETLVEQYAGEIVSTVLKLRNTHRHLEIFARFMEERYPLWVLNVYLAAFRGVDNSRIGVDFRLDPTSSAAGTSGEDDNPSEKKRELGPGDVPSRTRGSSSGLTTKSSSGSSTGSAGSFGPAPVTSGSPFALMTTCDRLDSILDELVHLHQPVGTEVGTPEQMNRMEKARAEAQNESLSVDEMVASGIPVEELPQVASTSHRIPLLTPALKEQIMESVVAQSEEVEEEEFRAVVSRRIPRWHDAWSSLDDLGRKKVRRGIFFYELCSALFPLPDQWQDLPVLEEDEEGAEEANVSQNMGAGSEMETDKPLPLRRPLWGMDTFSSSSTSTLAQLALDTSDDELDGGVVDEDLAEIEDRGSPSLPAGIHLTAPTPSGVATGTTPAAAPSSPGGGVVVGGVQESNSGASSVVLASWEEGEHTEEELD